jgi:hypothetical protein
LINKVQFYAKNKIYFMYIMSAWNDLVKKLCKENPGKPLGAILPLAKKMYKKTKNAASGTMVKMSRKSRRKSSSRRR